MRKRKAFTLLEVIISMGIILIAMGAIFMVFSVALRVFVEESTRTDIFIEADRGISRMAKELIGAKEIISSSSREVTFWISDMNSNGTREPEETVTYTWSGSPESSLRRVRGAAADPIAYGVYHFSLTYNDPFSPTLIGIKLTVGQKGLFSTVESSVKLRNIY